MDVNIASALVGVGVGWLLSQLTDLAKDTRLKKQKIDSIYIELSDVNAWLERTLKQCKYALQLIVLNQPINSIPAKIHTFIFDEHFHEICINIPRDSRIGLTDSYDCIKNINELIDQLKVLIDSHNDDKIKKICQKFEAIYSVAFETRFKINYLINNKNCNMKDLKGVAFKLDKQLNDEIMAIVQEAKELGLENVKSNFYAE